MKGPKGGGRRHLEHPARLGDALAHKELGLGDLLKDLLAALKVEYPDLGQAYVAVGAVEEQHAQPVFEIAEVLARHRPGDVERLSRGRKAPGLRDRHKHLHAGQFVHRDTLSSGFLRRNIMSMRDLLFSMAGDPIVCALQ
jgi:hypothetical protein